MDADASAKYGGLDFATVPAIAKPSTLSPKMLPFLWNLWKTIGRSKALLRERRAEAVIGMGGFTSLPPVYAGRKLGLATYIHDSNALPGKANRLTSRWCGTVLVGLEAARRYFPEREVVVTGTPVRRELAQLPAADEARQRFGLEPGKPTVLVYGGSQGGQGLNSLVMEASRELGPQIQWVHVAGRLDHERVRSEMAEVPHHAVLGFCDDMPSAYAAADLVICRAGASSLTELAFLGLPAVLVPYPYSADDHQTVNAEVFEQVGAAVLAQQRDLDGSKLAAVVAELLLAPEKLAAMSESMRTLAVEDSASRICDVLLGAE